MTSETKKTLKMTHPIVGVLSSFLLRSREASISSWAWLSSSGVISSIILTACTRDTNWLSSCGGVLIVFGLIIFSELTLPLNLKDTLVLLKTNDGVTEQDGNKIATEILSKLIDIEEHKARYLFAFSLTILGTLIASFTFLLGYTSYFKTINCSCNIIS